MVIPSYFTLHHIYGYQPTCTRFNYTFRLMKWIADMCKWNFTTKESGHMLINVQTAKFTFLHKYQSPVVVGTMQTCSLWWKWLWQLKRRKCYLVVVDVRFFLRGVWICIFMHKTSSVASALNLWTWFINCNIRNCRPVRFSAYFASLCLPLFAMSNDNAKSRKTLQLRTSAQIPGIRPNY